MDPTGLASTMQYLFMPIVVLLAVGALALILRWSQTPHRRRRIASRRGLLIPIARVPSQAAADRVASRLRGHGIRTASAATPAGIDVLVWKDQYGEARLYVRDADDGAQQGG